MSKYLLLVTFLLSTMPCLLQSNDFTTLGKSTDADCNFSGTWYGGNPDVPFPYYHSTITPISAQRFSIMFQYVSELESAGYLHATIWTGEISKTGRHSYSGMAFSEYQWNPASPLLPPGVDPNLPEMDFIHIKTVEFLDCDTIRFTYDFWFMYFNFTNDIKPVETPPVPPGNILVIDPPLVEVYHRIPTSVPEAVFSAGVGSAVAAPILGKPGLKPPFRK